ncbi:hypothetical protein [Pseudomonas syringae group genomosp. 3]|uniref:hypothetical protein n=1 Tax=Pseudomonas syringae group genomosp. 3 TaxID=251701 RepID=UPI000F00F031|nr:hypothetical protein [Pseudomonas syringae group genomosp. 3]
MVNALWVIAGLLVLVCYLLFLLLGAVVKLRQTTLVASDMNDENQRRVWSYVRRIRMVEHVLKDIRRRPLDVAERLHIFEGDKACEEEMIENDESMRELNIR